LRSQLSRTTLPAVLEASENGCGIDAALSPAGFDATCVATGLEHFPGSSADCSGNQYAIPPHLNLIPNTTMQRVVFESGSHQRN
jgi:hypothetical protein